MWCGAHRLVFAARTAAKGALTLGAVSFCWHSFGTGAGGSALGKGPCLEELCHWGEKNFL